ncbi:MAG TPA: Uma2 family endonuclease [Candidatus Lokiarchaeia archaeon]|nr:Uma2 family endonuclease [Candidatus Lokiarchaeia archaeon]
MIAVKLDPKQIKIRPDSGKIFFTYADIATMPEWPEGSLVEIIRGELFMVPSLNLIHERIAGSMQFILRDYVQQEQIGEVFNAPFDVVLSEENVFIPDICYVSETNAAIVQTQNIQGAPDLIVEILSQNEDRDRVYKKQVYEEYGVREYWIIDPKSKSVEVYLFDTEQQKYEEARIYSGEETIPVATVEGLEISVASIFPII